MKRTKTLINIVNLDSNGIQIIWLIKFKLLEKMGLDLTINAGNFLKKISLHEEDVYKFNQKIEHQLDKTSTNKISKFSYISYVLGKNLAAYKNLDNILKQKFELIYSPSSVLDLIFIPYILKKRNKKIVWVSVFDNTVPLTGRGNKVIKLFAWLFFQFSVKLLRRADRIFAVTPDLREYLIKRGFNQKKVAVTGNAVEADLIAKAEPNRKYNIDALFMGRINEKKGIYDLLESLKVVVKKMPDFKLGILGEGDKPTKEAFRSRIEKMGLEENVIFFGYRTGIEKYNILKTAKIFWFFSHDESFGVALLEAVCCGKPALVYKLNPYSEIYQHNEVKSFDFCDYKAIAEETERIFRAKDFQNQAGEKLLSKYNWHKIVELEYKSISNMLQ